MAVGQTRRYVVKPAPPGPSPSTAGVRVQEADEEVLEVSVGGMLFAKYNYGARVVRPYLFPVFAVPDVGITRNWPMVKGVTGETSDHPHHKGIYTAQGDVNGTNNWSDGEGHGFQVHRGFSELFDGTVFGGFTESLDWTDADHRPNMTETRSVRFYSSPLGKRIFDYTVSLHASHGEVRLGDTKEGGLLSVRVASPIDAANVGGGTITNSFGGLQEDETWGKRSAWCDYSGPLGLRWYGICMMDHPSNPRHPTPWHVRNYGLMTANCFGFHDFTGDPENRRDMLIPEGESRTWTYRVLIHNGTATEAGVGEHYHDFANPPKVTIEG